MNINLQHHNLLGNQISSKSEDFCIWWPFCTLVTMATTAILNLFNPPKSCHTLRWIFLKGFMKFEERNPKKNLFPPFLFPWQLRQSLSNQFRFSLAYLVPLEVDVVSFKFHQFLFGE
jgi:hypothetical protein